MENIKETESKVSLFMKSVSEMLTALEQTKIASQQIKEAAEISHKSVMDSKEVAEKILEIANEMNIAIHAIAEYTNKIS